jgi:hypothetical protein
MSTALTGAECDALSYLYGGGDEEIECWSARWVITRYKQKCVSILHKGAMTQPAGTRMVSERAKVEGKFGTCYTCAECIKRSSQELRR